ncbi:aminopeptidase P family protein [Micrococcales bacterium 31B]|nr:aminopeptidase P family protein [Micrococcales bacterium 31B]
MTTDTAPTASDPDQSATEASGPHPTADAPEPAETDQPLTDRVNNRSNRPSNPEFRAFIAADWGDDSRPVERCEAADFTSPRRERILNRFEGERLVLPAGPLKVRSNDTDYRFRPDSAYAYYSGLGTDREPDSVLVIERDADGNDATTLFMRPRSPKSSEEFYADARYGELWVGRRPTLEEVSTELGIACRHIDDLRDAISKDVGGGVQLRVLADVDQSVTALVNEIRGQASIEVGEATQALDDELREAASEARLVKDEYEIREMRKAVDATVLGFERIVRELPAAVGHARGERVVEGIMARTAREEGNSVGYDTIAASGEHACTLHWIRNDGEVREGDVILIDAGIEVDSLYTADITRSLPVSGTFSAPQREIYEAVLEAADAAFAVAQPGATFKDLHRAAIEVIARRCHEWGLLPGTLEESLAENGQFHRRWMVHGTSHHLGLDVHDCAQARREMYLDARLEPGMIFTIEPALYFMANDLKAPAEFRGIGVRIEDDILVTATGAENLSRALPRTPDEVERWMATLRD